MSSISAARRILANYLSSLVTKELAESLAQHPGLEPATVLKLKSLARAMDFESISPFPLSELPLYLTERGVPEDEAKLLVEAAPKKPARKVLSWYEAYSSLSKQSGKSVVYEGGLDQDPRAIDAVLVWTRALKALKPKARKVFDRHVHKIRLRNPRGSEDASWEPGGNLCLVVGKPLKALTATSFLTHELGHAIEGEVNPRDLPWGAPPFVSEYAESKPDVEDVAECFRVYVERPSELKRVAPVKFEILRGVVG